MTIIGNIRKRFIFGFSGQTVVFFDSFRVKKGWRSKTFKELNKESTGYSATYFEQNDDVYEISLIDLTPNSDNHWVRFYAKVFDFEGSFMRLEK